MILVGVVVLARRYRILTARIQLEVFNTEKNRSREVVLESEDEQLPTLEIQHPLKIRQVTLSPLSDHDMSSLASAGRTFSAADPIVPLVNQVSRFSLTYELEMPDDSWVPMKAVVYLPAVSQQRSPIMVFGSGTTGLGDHCAPSREAPAYANWGDYHTHLLTQAGQGYAVIFPDYIGFNDLQRPQAYFIADAEARAMISALQAVTTLPDLAEQFDASHIFLAGYSQGGHAALAAASHPDWLSAGQRIAGIVSYAGASDVQALLSDSPRLAPYVVRAYQAYYSQPGKEILPNAILQSSWVTDLNSQSEAWCIDEVFTKYPNTVGGMFTPEFQTALQTDTINIRHPVFAAALQQNSTFPQFPAEVPVYLLQGGSDPIVTATTQFRNRAEFCARGWSVQYTEYPGINHFQTRQAGFRDSNDWMRSIIRGSQATSNCHELSL